MSADPRDRAEIKERYEAQKVADSTRSAVRAAEAADELRRKRPAWQPEEDENGFVSLDNYRIPGMAWKPQPEERTGSDIKYRPDLPMPWLDGKVS